MKPKIEVNYYLLNGLLGTFNFILVTPKPDMTISDAFDLVRKKHKNDKNITEIRLLDVEQLKSEL